LTDAEATFVAEDENLTTTLSEIDRLISDVVAEKEVAAVISDKGKKVEETSSEGVNFDLRHLGGQQLSEEDISKLKEFAIPAATSRGQCSSVGSVKKLWDAFTTVPVLKL
jgi:hypothetical protein